MIHARLEQAFQARRMEEQLTELTARVARLERTSGLSRPLRNQEAQGLADAWDEYRKSLAADGEALSELRRAQLELMWQAILRVAPLAPAPRAALAEDETLVISWDRGPHHLEIEIFEDGSVEWFYMDATGATREGEEGQPVGAISPTMRDCLVKTFEQQE